MSTDFTLRPFRITFAFWAAYGPAVAESGGRDLKRENFFDKTSGQLASSLFETEHLTLPVANGEIPLDFCACSLLHHKVQPHHPGIQNQALIFGRLVSGFPESQGFGCD